MRKTFAVMAGLAMLAVACTDDGSAGPAPTTGGTRTTVYPGEPRFLTALRQIGDCDALLQHLRTEAIERVGPYGLGGYPVVFAVDAAATPPAGAEASRAAVQQDGDASAPGASHSTTNVQEQGVDEPDIVKTDGSRIVTLSSNGVLSIVDATRPQPSRVGSVKVAGENGWASDLLLAGDKALVFGSAWVVDGGGERVDGQTGVASDMTPGRQLVTITEVSLADPANPALGATLRLDGWYVTSRLVDDVARVVVRSEPVQLPFVYPQGEAGEQLSEETNRKVVEQSTLEDWLPSYELTGPDGTVRRRGPLSDCERVHAPTEFSGFGTLSVLTFDLSSTLGDGDATSVLAGGETAYASADRLYVATTAYVDPTVFERDDEEEIERLQQDFGTSIHAFDISGSEPARYLASGEVPGHLINQFAMSEHEGKLRAATTRGMPWNATDTSESLITVLEQQGDALVPVGQVGDMGRGESIYSVRYSGDVAYVVTFRRTDPFYTVDLSDPAAPRVLGELKIPGYSSYLHPIEDDLVIGVGQQATDEGRIQGLKVSLFDVSDLAAPAELATWTLRDSSSVAEYDHHAFLYWPATKQLVLPLNVYSPDDRDGFFGAVVLHVDRSGITEAGRVEHPPVEVPGERYGCAKPLPVEPELGGRSSPSAGPAVPDCPAMSQPDAVQRALVVGDSLWTLGEWTLHQHGLADLSLRGSVPID
ncbi:MAG TPA: beta-propeller domain-containing protein [Acidimicrobiales bacterium]